MYSSTRMLIIYIYTGSRDGLENHTHTHIHTQAAATAYMHT